ncbi:MAG: hypothetical protein U1D32_01800, partial [Patescibacteria group bacterium]|nr:hypothetical protein [Patescibacteria group bacterium]
RLTDPEGNSQVRPYFAVTWIKDGQTHVVTSFNRGGANSDSWGKWVNSSGSATNGYKASGSTFTSDEVKPVTWTVTSPTGSVTSKSVPNKTLTQFLQQDVPEGADVNWTASGEDRYGASDVGTSASDTFYSLFSTPRATHHASSLGDVTKQVSMNYRRFGAPTGAGFHKNTRPNLLPPGSTKKFFDLNGAVTEDITDGQLVRVETKLKNTGETPTKKYEIYDYLGSIRDFEPPITTSSDLPITVQYNDGAERAVEPLISRVIPNRSNGNLDQVENVISSDDDRRASYKLDFGTNPDQAANVSVTKNGKDYSSCSYASTGLYCATDYAAYPNSVYFYCGFDGRWVGGCNGGYDASAVWSYRLDGAPTGTYDLTLSYYNRPNPDYPPPNYGSYHVKVDYPGGSRTVNLPIESNSQANGLHTFVLQGLDITGANPTVTLTWDNDAWNPGDANFGLNSLRLATAEDDTSDSILRRGQLNPGETVALRYYVRANRNRTTTDDSDPNNNFQRRLKVGSATGPIVPQPDPKGGTVDVGDAHVFVPYSEDYCNRSNPLLNHTCEFEPGDVLAPWLRGQRGSIASNEGIFGYDPLAGEENATFLVQANGVLSHFSGGAGNLGGYQAAPATCAPSGDLDWRKEMYKNIQKLVAGDTHNMGSTVPAVMNLESGGNVWYRDGDLTLPARPDPARFRGVGTIVVKGNLTIEGEMAYDTNNTAINSLGIIVLGNINVKDSVTKMVGTYYVSDIDRDLAGQSNGCPVVDAANGVFTTGSSKTRLDVRGALVARQFNFQRYFVDPSDSVADPAENVYYDGRVVANTPPGFGVFRDTASWYEIAP